MTKRIEKVNSLLKQQIGQILLEESYDDLTGIVTVTRVEVTADLSEVKVYISAVGQETDEVLEILNKNIYEIQGRLNKQLVMRKLPRIAFVPDERSQVAEKINQIMDDLEK